MRLANNIRADNVTDYSTHIRGYLETHNGRPHRTYREIYDAHVDEDGNHKFNSLWATPAQEAMWEIRLMNAARKLKSSVSAGT